MRGRRGSSIGVGINAAAPEQVTRLLSNSSVAYIEVHGQATTFDYKRVIAPVLKQPLADERGMCNPCSIWAMMRPRRVLTSILRNTPIASSSPLVCLKVRSGRANPSMFAPPRPRLFLHPTIPSSALPLPP